jgi:hypothetical protein
MTRPNGRTRWPPRASAPTSARRNTCHHHDGLAEESSDNLTEEELRELIDDLNVDETAELVALVWVGRGDYDAAEWADALAAARERANKRTAKYLLGMPLLADWLEEGLEAIGA